MKAIFKLLALVFLGMFLYALYVQINDPDATLWYFIYGIAALASILFLMNKLPFSIAVILFLGYVVGCALFWPEQYEGLSLAEGNVKNIEEGREAVGMLITAGIMMLYAFGVKANKK